MKSLSLPVLMDSNFELWRQNLNLVALALNVPDALAKDIKGPDCKDPKHFYVLTQCEVIKCQNWLVMFC